MSQGLHSRAIIPEPELTLIHGSGNLRSFVPTDVSGFSISQKLLPLTAQFCRRVPVCNFSSVPSLSAFSFSVTCPLN